MTRTVVSPAGNAAIVVRIDLDAGEHLAVEGCADKVWSGPGSVHRTTWPDGVRSDRAYASGAYLPAMLTYVPRVRS